MRQWCELIYRGWDVWRERDGDERWLSAEPSQVLLRRTIGAGHWPSPRFGSEKEAKAWIDESAPFKLPRTDG